MPILDRRTLSVARTLFILAVAAAFIFAARQTLLAFLMGIFFAYLISPLVSRVQHWRPISRGSRTIAIAEVYVIVALVATGIIIGIGPSFADDGRQLISAIPALLEKHAPWDIVHRIGSTRGWSYQTQLHIDHFLAQHRDTIVSWAKQFGLQVGAVLAHSFWILLIPILAIPFLNDAPEMVEVVFRVLRLRPQARTFAELILQDIHSMAANYIRAQMTLACLAIVAYTVVLSASGVPYGPVLGVTAGMLEFIPLVGPIVGAVLILGVAFLAGFHHILLLMLFLGCWRVLQDYFNSPRLMHNQVQLHPFVVIFAVLAGAEIAGVIGVFLSIPIAATIKIIWRSWRAYYERDSRMENTSLRSSHSKAA
ncbi:MAG TPA: AI-2E family transporter [Candidatus Eisenbacteria bacterium]|nr:AI-2E family transporter [Candidatus Eisenbacteria bacterium]